MSFVLENEIYDLLKKVGIKTPRYAIIKSMVDIQNAPFESTDEIVFKGIATNLWHKSDIGLVQFSRFDHSLIASHLQSMPNKIEGDQVWQHGLIVEKVNFKKCGSLPNEIFVSLKRDPSCGWMLLWGFGGVQSEFWANQIPPCILNLTYASPEELLKKIEQHPFTEILLGRVRGSTAILTKEKLSEFCLCVLNLPNILDSLQLDLLEINPLVINQNGDLTPLDGVGLRSVQSPTPRQLHRNLSFDKLFQPKTVGIVGLSSRVGSPTNIIYENIQKSNCEIVVVKDPKELISSPVDLLIVGINARNTYELIHQLLSQGGGAEYLYLVTGGIADGSDHLRLGESLIQELSERRRNNLWTPTLIGPNGLGIVSMPVRLNSLFIPEDKLPIAWPLDSTTLSTAIISQSGAYLITRLSRETELRPCYAISIGSKMDLKIPDLLRLFEQKANIKTIGLYVEGLDTNEAIESAQIMRASQKTFIIYKGGRSALGAKAAQSHTGAMMTDHGLMEATFDLDNVTITNSFAAWKAQLLWKQRYPSFTKKSKWGFITNAGYESVGSGDFALTAPEPLDPTLKQNLTNLLNNYSLQDLVSPANPLDLTPMANEDVWLACAEAFLGSEIQTLFLGIVPLTPRLETRDGVKTKTFAESISKLAQRFEKQIGIILDCGTLYDSYRSSFTNAGLPVFASIEEAMTIFE